MDLLITGADSDSMPMTKLYRNDGDWLFSESPSNIINLINSSVDCKDYNHDGFPDIIIEGDDGTNRVTKIYKNLNGEFIDIGRPFTNTNFGSVKWLDFDNDGEMDFVQSGLKGEPFHSGPTCIMYAEVTSLQFYHNDGNDAFSLSSEKTHSQAYGRSSISVGDVDNDGGDDVAVSGTPGIGRCIVGINWEVGYIDEMFMSSPRLYKNQGNGIFSDMEADIPRCFTWGSHDYCVFGEFISYSIKLGDFNNDGLLDILRTGNGGYGFPSTLYINKLPAINNPPSIPTGLTTEIISNGVTLSWNNSSDDHTSSNNLVYRIYLRDTANMYQVSKVNLDF
ncbi:MAG: VCBS repeat-containing protein [Bacteroidales bacterium]|nr:VCBS repeat-containing protein [Bacteroidales bacterium]